MIRSVAILAVSALIAAPSCGAKTTDNPQGLPLIVRVRAVPGYGVTERLTSPRAVGAPFIVELVYIYQCGYAGLYRDADGTCY